MNQILQRAIEDRIVIQFYYEGQLRIVEPFTLGYLKDTGSLALNAYQVGGYSKSRKSPPWRNYLISGISRLQLTDEIALSFREDYNSHNSKMSKILCTV